MDFVGVVLVLVEPVLVEPVLVLVEVDPLVVVPEVEPVLAVVLDPPMRNGPRCIRRCSLAIPS